MLLHRHVARHPQSLQSPHRFNRFNRRIAAFYLSLLPCITHLGEKIPTPDQ
jgi:hypothetical protein